MVASAGMRRSSSSSMKRRPGSLLTVALLLLLVALLGQLQAVAATKYILNWNYPNYQNYFSNWNRGNNYVVGDSIGESKTFSWCIVFMLHQLLLVIRNFCSFSFSFCCVFWVLLFMCFDLVLLVWLLLLMIRVCVQRWSTWCGESELPRVLPMLHQSATRHQWNYSVSSGTNRDALLHLHHPWPLRSRYEACNQCPLVAVDAAAHHHDLVCKLQIMQLWVQTPKEKTGHRIC